MRAMRALFSCGLLLTVGTASVAAQSRPEPRLVFSVFGGVAGHGSLWSIPKQPFALLFGPPQWDTLQLNRRLTTAATVGLNATIYRTPSFGVTGEIAYVGLRIDDSRTMLFTNTDVQNRNLQVCNDVTRRTRTVSNVSFTVGVAYRLAPRSAVKPYARLQGGAAVRSSSLIEMSGQFVDQTVGTNRDRPIILGGGGAVSVHPVLIGAAGVTFAISPGYHLRFELRDHFVALERVTGPADDFARVETEGFFGHVPALVFGVDIVLEQRRGRRY